MINRANLANRLIDGTIEFPETLTYATASTVTIVGDWTGIIKVGTKIELTQTTAKYGYVTAVSYSAPNTTLTLHLNTAAKASATVANAAITGVYFSNTNRLRAHPIWVSWTPTITSAGGTITSYTVESYFKCDGNTCFIKQKITITNNGTGSVALRSTPPIAIGTELPTNAAVGYGREGAATGNMFVVYIASGVLQMNNYNNAYPGGTNYTPTWSGFYELQ